ncbi:CmcJ/NvfI family oxidoreductase [Spectribacter hydrogenoxidans]|uniref:CmcJ/NvfI family oxidoreductase n=1 Tax=Spectribacter hydrogenoxidans TaxID=3075608 RepID=A0ABU3BYT1_9GAMM|nr:CmcJ/NvfI family oxidoreductase [Salinisphaera sp. W335]MDT0634477.1 CmcJ/NvfI family oxidoreductase [Salinisphaera sp. W335]
MSATTETLESAGAVHATLNFMVKDGQRPYVRTEALTGAPEPEYVATMADHQVPIHDARPEADALSLEREGIAYRDRPVDIVDFYDDAEVRARYYPNVVALIRDVTGASRVEIFDHTRRRDGGGDAQAKQPASRVHNDYTDWSGAQRVRDVLGAEEAARLRDTPFAQINVWRSIAGPVKRSPLALLDATSLDPDDLIGTDMHYPDRVGEIYHLAYNPAQRWLYFPDIGPASAILIKGFDSRTDGRARFTPHSAFTDPRTRPEDPARESIEVRTLAFF